MVPPPPEAAADPAADPAADAGAGALEVRETPAAIGCCRCTRRVVKRECIAGPVCPCNTDHKCEKMYSMGGVMYWPLIIVLAASSFICNYGTARWLVERAPKRVPCRFYGMNATYSVKHQRSFRAQVHVKYREG